MLTGHVVAILGAIGFAYSTSTAWGGLLAAFGVAGNHFADCIDGTHARSTNQCRNGGELLDHFTDPLSFAYWIAAWSVAAGNPELGLAGVIVLYATAVLTNIKAKMIGEFTLATFGPTEFKAGLVLFGLLLALLYSAHVRTTSFARIALLVAVAVGLVQLVRGLAMAVREVNRDGAPPDTSEWETVREKK